MYQDPVCKKNIMGDEVKAKYTYDRKTYRFCSVDCQEQFVSNPLQYIGISWWHKFRSIFSSLEKAKTH